MPLTAILSLHKYELLALNILHQNCWCKWSKSFDCYLKLIFSQSIDHFLHDRSTHVEKGCICDTHTEFWKINKWRKQVGPFAPPAPRCQILSPQTLPRSSCSFLREIWKCLLNCGGNRLTRGQTLVDAIIEIKRVIISAHVSKATEPMVEPRHSRGGGGGVLVFQQFTLI